MAPDFDAPRREQLDRPTSRKWSLRPGTIGAWVAEMDFGTAPAVEEALVAAVRDGVLGYATPAMAREAADATSDWYGAEYGWRPDPDRVHAVTDVLSAFELAVRYLSRPGSAVVVPTPAYMPFLTMPEALGRAVVQVPGHVEDGRWGLDLDGVEAALRAGAGTVVLCNPHNPTGRVHDRAELAALAELVERYGALVFADEVHAPLRFERAHVPYASVSDAAAAHSVTATSASKAWNVPGLKAAQLVLTADPHEERFRRLDLGHLREPSTLGVVAAVAAYRHGRGWLRDVVRHLDGQRRLLGTLLAETLPEIGFTPPEATYLTWLDCAALDLPGGPVTFFADRAGVTTTAGGACGAGFEQYVRVVFATPTPILRELVSALGAAVHELRGPASGS